MHPMGFEVAPDGYDAFIGRYSRELAPRFDELWSPFSHGIGPAAEYLQAQDPARRISIREAYFDLLGRPADAFVLPAKVIAVRGRTTD